MSLMDAVKAYANKVNEFMFNLLPLKPKLDFLYSASRHLLKAGGKRLRPFLVIQSCLAVGGEEEVAIPMAAAVELIHNFTLIHDDIMDKDEFRRGVPTVHVIWGIPMAILAGDLLFSKAFEAVFYCSRYSSISLKRLTEAGKRLAEAVSTIAEGQALDMKMSGILKEKIVDEKEYFEMISKKTAALFKVSCEIGALIGGGTEEQILALSRYGDNIGIAFQMWDDILGVVADEKVLGKPVGSDLREGKCTLILIHALKNADEIDKEFIMNIYGKDDFSKDDFNRFLKILEKTGSIKYVLDIAKKHVEVAKDSLRILPESNAKSLLIQLADFIVSRKY